MEANEPTITTQAELCAAWETLTRRSGHGGRSLGLLLLHADGTPVHRAGVAMHPVHRANDASVLVVAPDDLTGAA
jgi:hypothetical protein